MKPRKHGLILFIACLLIAALACSLQPDIASDPVANPPQEEVDNPAPPEPEPEEPQDEPVEEPPDEPSLPGDPASNTIDPIGLAVQKRCQKAAPCMVDGESHENGVELQLISADGQSTFSVHIPANGSVVHIASRVDFSNPGIVTFLYRNSDNQLFEVWENGNVIETFPSGGIRSIQGAPGQKVFAISYLPGMGTASGNSEIHIYPGMSTIAAADDNMKVVIPVIVHGDGVDYTVMWFTYQPYGIGGDIIFPPEIGLYHVEGSGTPVEILNQTGYGFGGLSEDGSLASYETLSDGVTVVDLATEAEVTIPLQAGMDRGAGFVTFSPDNQKLAWIEAKGSGVDGTLEMYIRTAGVDGSVLATEATVVFYPDLGFIRTASWLDSDRVLLAVDVYGQDEVPFVVVLNAGDLTSAGSFDGSFVGLIYQ